MKGLYDVRYRPQLWLTLSEALLAKGDFNEARDVAAKAHEASLEYDGPQSAAVAVADAALRRADDAMKSGG